MESKTARQQTVLEDEMKQAKVTCDEGWSSRDDASTRRVTQVPRTEHNSYGFEEYRERTDDDVLLLAFDATCSEA